MPRDFKSIMEVGEMTLGELSSSTKVVLIENRQTKQKCYIGGVAAKAKWNQLDTPYPFMTVGEIRGFWKMLETVSDTEASDAFWNAVRVKKTFGGSVEEIEVPDG